MKRSKNKFEHQCSANFEFSLHRTFFSWKQKSGIGFRLGKPESSKDYQRAREHRPRAIDMDFASCHERYLRGPSCEDVMDRTGVLQGGVKKYGGVAEA